MKKLRTRASMEPCMTPTWDVQTSTNNTDDRISSLPDDLLSRILSWLPTKDAAATKVLSKSISHAFSGLTSLDFDSPSISSDWPSFAKFVDDVLQALCECKYLSKFRFHHRACHEMIVMGYTKLVTNYNVNDREFLALEVASIDAWIGFPLARKVRELDLCIHVFEPGVLPSWLLTCETLEVLKLDVNYDLDVSQVSLTSLLNLRVLHLCSIWLNEDNFLSRLVSVCPSLEELVLKSCQWKDGDSITIASSSLKKLVLHKIPLQHHRNSDLVRINTPNLQQLDYLDNVAYQYSIRNMNALDRANISIWKHLRGHDEEVSFRNMLLLLRKVSNAQHLSFMGYYFEILGRGELKNHLPMFRNLRFLELRCWGNFQLYKVLVKILKCSPFLETLVFPQGLIDAKHSAWLPDDPDVRKAAELESQCCSTTQAIPSCCTSYLKRIVIGRYSGLKQEFKFVKFLLSIASVLEELVIYREQGMDSGIYHMLQKLPRASVTCSIKVQ